MKSFVSDSFRRQFRALPAHIQEQARESYALFMVNPAHPSLRFKPVHSSVPSVYSARVSRDYRVIGKRTGDQMVWFWVGSHDEYEQMLRRL